MLIPNLKPIYASAFASWQKDNVPRLAAAFSFFAMLSLSPMLVLVVEVLGYGYGSHRLTHLAESYMGRQGATFVTGLINSSLKPSATTIATILSLILAIYGASNLFQQLYDSIHAIWNFKPKHTGIKAFVFGRIASVAMALVFFAVLIIWLGIDWWLGWAQRHTHGFQGWEAISFVVSVTFLTFAFALTFKSMPHGMVAWRDVWLGAISAAIGIGISKFLLSLYFSLSSISAVYGSAGTLVIVLLWIYYSAQIFFYGIEITCTYAHMYGSQSHRVRNQPPLRVAD